MIIPDTNLLVYAYNNESPQYAEARQWWENTVAGNENVGIPWVVSMGFIRLMTNPRVLSSPLPTSTATELVQEWFEYKHITAVNPGVDHIRLLHQLLQEAGRGGNLVPDAHIAAIAMEHQAVVHTYNVSDFARFTGIQWSNPLLPAS